MLLVRVENQQTAGCLAKAIDHSVFVFGICAGLLTHSRFKPARFGKPEVIWPGDCVPL